MNRPNVGMRREEKTKVINLLSPRALSLGVDGVRENEKSPPFVHGGQRSEEL
jgi:hypothetical protein